MNTHRTLPPTTAWLAVCGVAISSAAPPARAEESPYSAGAAVALLRDDNLFRSSEATAAADQRTSATLFGEIDQRTGRHQLQGQLALTENRYRTFNELDHLAWRSRLAWSGGTVGEVTWLLSHDAARQLASYGTVAEPGFRDANIQTVQHTQANLQLGMDAQWVALGSLSHRRLEHTAQAFERERVQLTAVALGAQWNPQGPLSASVGPRLTRGRVPMASDGIDRGFRRRDIDFGLRWVPTGASTLNARLSITRQTPDTPSASQAEFSGATGQLAWAWAVTGRTRLNVALSRETGSETAFYNPTGQTQGLEGIGDDSQLTTALKTRMEVDLSGKITLALDAQVARRRLVVNSVVAGGGISQVSQQSGSDRTSLVKLGVRYAATRSVQLACDVGREDRRSNTSLSQSYRANTVGCDAQITLRWS